MTNNLGKITIHQKSGNEPLTFNKHESGLKLIDFWQWGFSDIISNATRGTYAEFIVASAINIDLKNIRQEWSPYDLTSPEGIRIEVKSAAYIQSWNQKDFSTIKFSIKEATYWVEETMTQTTIAKRHADVYVFCLLKHKDQATLDPMNLDQWEFYVLSTLTLNNYKLSQNSISLKALQNLTGCVNYEQLGPAIRSSYFNQLH